MWAEMCMLVVSITVLGAVFMFQNRNRMTWALVRSLWTTGVLYSGAAMSLGILFGAGVDFHYPKLAIAGVIGCVVVSRVKGRHTKNIEAQLRNDYLSRSTSPQQSNVALSVYNPSKDGALSATRMKHLNNLSVLLGIANETGRSETAKLTNIRQSIETMMKIEVQAALGKSKEREQRTFIDTTVAALRWLWQKRGEVFQLDISDFIMGYAIAEVKGTCTYTKDLLVNLQDLAPIHPIDRKEAMEKTEERAQKFVEARHILREANWELHDYMTWQHPELAAFRSLTGFEVVEIDGKYVTFEGNGRREALQIAMTKDEMKDAPPVKVEVKLYKFEDPSHTTYWINKTRKWKKVPPYDKASKKQA